jgi:RND family efflux transporter MFP subunit
MIKNRILTPIILVVALCLTLMLIYFKPQPEEKTPERPITAIEVITAQPQSLRLRVHSQGTVLPKIESNLAVEVSGRIIEVAENFRPGGRFRKGDVLFKIDPIDYTVAVAARTAELAQANLNLAQEEALAAQAAADWQAIGAEQAASALTLRQPQLAQAQARVASAQALLQRAQRDLQRTEVKAPFDGRVLTQNADLGQYVSATPGSSVARIYATDFAEVRLPLSQREADYLDDPSQSPAWVELRAGTRAWAARLVRLEATIDPQSRLLYGVAEVPQPFAGDSPLRRGLFVDASIEGRRLEHVYQIPRLALRGSDTVYIRTQNNTLQQRKVSIVKSDTASVIIDDGLLPGEEVAISPIAYFVENMPVQLIDQ